MAHEVLGRELFKKPIEVLEHTPQMSSLPVFYITLVFAAFKTADASPWEMIEVRLVSEHYKDTAEHKALDDFQELFDEFAETHGIHYNKRNFRILESYPNGMPMAKYGIRNTNCEEFRQFLSGIKAQKYHLQYASVRCGPMTFSYCMAFSCNHNDFPAATTTTTTTAK